VLKSVVNKIAFSSIAAVLAVCQPASAQLNVGRYGVQPGLEGNYLQYQLGGESLSRMRVIPGCVTGFGATCSKTGGLLQQLLDTNDRTSYSNLLLRATGGEQNFQNFATFYGNNPRLPEVPYSSFWQSNSRNIMDSYQYLLGQSFSRDSVAGLGTVTKNFYWAPLSGDNNSLSLRSGLLNFKYSYGRLLLEEAAKIPNIQEQIQSLGLPKDVTQFYLSNLSRGFQALNTGNEYQLKDSILRLLSAPYSPDGGDYGRMIAGIPNELDLVYGQGLEATSFVGSAPLTLEPEAIALDFPGGEIGTVLNPGGNRFPGWLLGLPVAGLLLLLLLGGDSGDNSSSGGNPISNPGVTPTPPPPTPGPSPGPGVCPIMPGGNGVPNNNTNCVVPPPVGNGQEQPTKVPEASTVSAVLLMALVLCVLKKTQKRCLQEERSSTDFVSR
jgi:hypothetical protein